MTNEEIVKMMIEDAKAMGREIPKEKIEEYLKWDNGALDCMYSMSKYWQVQ